MPAHRADGRAARPIAAALASVVLLGAPVAAATAAAPAETLAPTEVAIIVPLVAPPRVAGLIPTEELAELTAADGALSRALDAVQGEQVTLAVDPLIAASINALGAEAPPDAIAWVQRLDRTPQDRFLLLTADADPTLLRQAGEPLPALGTVWTSPGTVSMPDVAAFAAAGASRILVADVDLAGPDGGERPDDAPPVALAAADGIGLRVVDTTASAALQAAADAPSAASLGALRAEISGDGERASIIVGLERTGDGWSGLDAALDALHSDLGLELVGLDALDGETVDVAIADGAQPEDRLEPFRALVAAEQADAAFASIMFDADAFRAERRLRSHALAGVGWASAGAAAGSAWATAVADAVDASGVLRSGVRIEESDSLFLADRSSIPISIVNDLDRTITVVVTARSSNGRLDVDRTPVTVEIAPASRTSVAFGATAVSNGTVAVTARLSAPDGTPIGQAALARINVQAGWETPLTAVAAAVLLLVVVVGIVRTVRRVRRTRAGATAGSAGPAGEDAGGSPAEAGSEASDD